MTKTISIHKNNWNKLNKIKEVLDDNSDEKIHWDDTISHIIEIYNLHKEKINVAPPTPKSPPLLKKKEKGNKQNKINKANKKPQDGINLVIPPTPKKKPIVLNVSTKDIEKISNKETKKIKYILIECPICGNKPITMPIPKKMVLEADLPVVDISYVHGNPEHVLVAQLDHDFQVRRRRASWVVFEKEFKKK